MLSFGAAPLVEDDGVLVIDGSVLEGGGQILRNSVSLASLLGRGIRIEKIRANRPKGGGLKAQHLAGVKLVSHMFRGTLIGDEIGSNTLAYRPRVFTPGVYVADIQTAGAIALVVQVGFAV